MILVKFSCDECNLVNAEVMVREREEGEDVMHYLNRAVMLEVSFKHQVLSLGCEATHMKNLMIPSSEKGVGFPDAESQEES